MGTFTERRSTEERLAVARAVSYSNCRQMRRAIRKRCSTISSRFVAGHRTLLLWPSTEAGTFMGRRHVAAVAQPSTSVAGLYMNQALLEYTRCFTHLADKETALTRQVHWSSIPQRISFIALHKAVALVTVPEAVGLYTTSAGSRHRHVLYTLAARWGMHEPSDFGGPPMTRRL